MFRQSLAVGINITFGLHAIAVQLDHLRTQHARIETEGRGCGFGDVCVGTTTSQLFSATGLDTLGRLAVTVVVLGDLGDGLEGRMVRAATYLPAPVNEAGLFVGGVKVNPAVADQNYPVSFRL